jgi:hypothetical protein
MKSPRCLCVYHAPPPPPIIFVLLCCQCCIEGKQAINSSQNFLLKRCSLFATPDELNPATRSSQATISPRGHILFTFRKSLRKRDQVWRPLTCTISWDVTPCSFVDSYWIFEGTFCLNVLLKLVIQVPLKRLNKIHGVISRNALPIIFVITIARSLMHVRNCHPW